MLSLAEASLLLGASYSTIARFNASI